MKLRQLITVIIALTAVLSVNAQREKLDNPSIDIKTFLKNAKAAAKHRDTRRLSEEDFIKAAAEPDTTLDARSRSRFDDLHIKGAVNLSFSDITVDSLAKLLPDKNIRILIYCNNNFRGNEMAFPTKVAPASLNLSTYIALYTYGYRNIYELGPLLDTTTTKLELIASPKPEIAGK